MTTPKVDKFIDLHNAIMDNTIYEHRGEQFFAGFLSLSELARKLEKQNIVLLAALRKYGEHHKQCGIGGSWIEGTCDCGLTNVLHSEGIVDE